MKIVYLDAKTLGDDLDLSAVSELGEAVIYENTPQEQVKDAISDAEVVIVNKLKLNESNLPFAPKLKLICVTATGYDNIDIEYCKEKNIRVRNVPGYCTESVCQHTFTLLFALIENVRYYDDFVKSGAYSESGVANHLGRTFFEIAGKKWGIIGLGAIGRAVADCATAFGAQVSYSSISGKVREEKYENVPLETLLRESDILTVHAPLNEKTTNLIGEKELAMMKKSAFISFFAISRISLILASPLPGGTIAPA